MGLFGWLAKELVLLGAAREPMALMYLQLRDQLHVPQTYHVHPGIHQTVAEAEFHLWAEAHHGFGSLVAVHHEVAVSSLGIGNIPHHLNHFDEAAEDQMEPKPFLHHLPVAVEQDLSLMAAEAQIAHWCHFPLDIQSSLLHQKLQLCVWSPCHQLHKNTSFGQTNDDRKKSSNQDSTKIYIQAENVVTRKALFY